PGNTLGDPVVLRRPGLRRKWRPAPRRRRNMGDPWRGSGRPCSPTQIMTRRIELPVRVLPGDRLVSEETALDYEWLFTNGLGGFASGTVANIPTRRYHGLLVAALPAPHGRMVMLSHV